MQEAEVIANSYLGLVGSVVFPDGERMNDYWYHKMEEEYAKALQREYGGR
jgi:hypothetical protein